MKPAIRFAAVVVVSLLAFAASAPAELAKWDQAKVTELGKQLETATGELFQSFRRQPEPTRGSPQRQRFFQLRQEVRQLRRDSRSLSRSLQRGEDQEATAPIYRSMMQTVRAARDNARSVFSGADVQERAGVAMDILNQLTPFYDASATPLAPVNR